MSVNKKKKRSRSSITTSVFDAIQELDNEDILASSKKKTRQKSEERKTKAAQSQVALYKHLMECRILLQKSRSDGDAKDKNNDSMVDACNELLVHLLQARNKLCFLDSDVDYKEIVNRDDDSEKLESVLQQEYETCRDDWKEVLDRRYKDLRLHAGLTAKQNFKVVDSSFWQQVQATVSHEEALFSDKNKNIFDDTKVYQHQLAEFLSTAASSSSQQGQQQQKRRVVQNKKNVVDRKASKGRKIRYAVIPKLVNFTFPVARPQNTSITGGMDEDEWFASLFGGAGSSK